MINKPFWSIMIPTHNCAKFTKETLNYVLAQDLGPNVMQIEVIDDCSDDNIQEVVLEIGKGRVSFYRQESNVGHTRNFQTAIERANGEVIHLLHGDDFVLPGFYTEMMNMYRRYPEMGACFCRHHFVNSSSEFRSISRELFSENTLLHDYHKVLMLNQQIQTPSITVKKEVYKKLGMFNTSLVWAEDWEMWVRIAKNYPMGYICTPLACYRKHEDSSSGTKFLSGSNAKDLMRLYTIFKSYVENKNEKKNLKEAFDNHIYNIAKSNYVICDSKGLKEGYRHLIVMAKYTNSIKLAIYYFLKYIKGWLDYRYILINR